MILAKVSRSNGAPNKAGIVAIMSALRDKADLDDDTGIKLARLSKLYFDVPTRNRSGNRQIMRISPNRR